MKRPIAILGLVGLIGCFLPLGLGISFFDIHHVAWMPVILMLAAFALPTFVGFSATDPGAALAGVLGFGYVVFRYNTDLIDLVIHADIGGKMMGVAAIAGLLTSLSTFAKPTARK